MNILITVIVSAAVAIASFFGAYNYIPQDILQITSSSPTLGAAITTIAGSDTISSSRTTINTNFANLDSDKIEVSTTTLPVITTLTNLVTVGTIGTGVWQGTAVTVANGGTGSTTLSSNQVLLGAGTTQVAVVNGFGASGQFLTSNGDATAPTWQTSAVSLTDSYDWTGLHTFNATTSVAGFRASSTAALPMILNNLTVVSPSVQGASSTVLHQDGSGNQTWDFPDWDLLAATTTENNMLFATTSTFSTAQDLKVIYSQVSNFSSAVHLELRFNTDADTNYGVEGRDSDDVQLTTSNNNQIRLYPTSSTSPAYVVMNIFNSSSDRKQVTWISTVSVGASAPTSFFGAGVWNNTSDQITNIVFTASAAVNIPSGTFIRVYGRRD